MSISARRQASRVASRHGGCETRIVKTTVLFLWVGALVSVIACRSADRSNRTESVRITDVGGYVEYVARDYRQRQVSNINNDRTSSKETIMEENLKLEAEGFVYHPNLLEFTVGGLFGLIQEDFNDEFGDRERSSSNDGEVYEFDLALHFLKKKPYPGSVFAQRHRRIEPRPFQSSLETTTTNYGFNWQYVSETTPTTLTFSHNDVHLDPLDKDEEPGRQRNTLLRFDTSYRFSDSNVLSFDYNYQKTMEQPFDLNYEINEFTLGHLLNFGPSKTHRLESEVNYYDQRGSFEIERFRWRETLRLQHSDTLRSWFRTELLDRTQGSQAGVPPIEERSYYVSGTVEHDLYESLRTQLFLFGNRQDFETGADIKRLGSQLNFDYRKSNPWGRLLARYRWRLECEERTGTNQQVEVVDEPHGFHDPDPVTLSFSQINVSSIRVISDDRLTQFQSTRDYRVRSFGNYVELERVPTGRIADGQEVLISYVYTLAGDYKLNTEQREFDIRQKFDFGLTPYYRLLWQDQKISPEDAAGVIPEDITEHTVGVEFEKSSLRLTAEYQDRDSTINPTIGTRLGASFTRRFSTGATGVVKARWSDIKRLDEIVRRTRYFTIETRYRHPFPRGLTVEGAVLYRREKDTLNGNDDGVDVDLTIEWLIRETELRLTYEYGKYEDNFSDNETSTLYVQLRRRF